jgi:uncharacterized membrane protein
MAFTGSFTNQLTSDQSDAVNGIVGNTFDGILDFAFTLITYVIGFVTQASVMGFVVALAIMLISYRVIRGWFLRKQL